MNWHLSTADRIFLKHLRIAPDGSPADDRPCPACRTGLRRSALVRRRCRVCGGTGLIASVGRHDTDDRVGPAD